MNKLQKGLSGFRIWILHLFQQPVFLFVTLWGHLAIFLGALFFYFLESSNPKIPTFLHSYYWAISVATTVGSDIAPQTVGGKIVAIYMMVVGALFLWSYTALFAAALVSPDMKKVGKEVEEIEEELKGEMSHDRESLDRLANELEEIKKLLKAKVER